MYLGPLKYRKVLAKFGGPIDRVTYAKTVSPDGKPWFESTAHLLPHLKPKKLKANYLYGNCDGSGTDRHKNLACYKAISEALERWAYWTLAGSEKGKEYGFDVDNSSTGLAAFPGLSKRQVRLVAYYEAAERWALVEWWLGKLSVKRRKWATSRNDSSAVEIVTPFKDVYVAVIWKKLVDIDAYAYGFSGEASFEKAVSKAWYELARNETALRSKIRNQTTLWALLRSSKIKSTPDKKLLFSGTQEGFAKFREKAASDNVSFWYIPPRKIVDREILGEWSQYTTVWRVLYEPSIPHEEARKDLEFFLF